MDAPPVYSQPPAAQPPKRNNAVIWIVVAVLGLCACSVPILAAILFPVFAQARLAAQRTECLTRVKALGTAHLLYVSDNDDQFVPAKTWMDGLKPYLPAGKDGTVLRCPLDKDGYGYAMADALSGKNVRKLANASRTILTFETPDDSYNAHGDPKSVSHPPRHVRMVVGYADGSARILK
jgi:hypothetical protein